jgi:hypothetical protein
VPGVRREADYTRGKSSRQKMLPEGRASQDRDLTMDDRRMGPVNPKTLNRHDHPVRQRRTLGTRVAKEVMFPSLGRGTQSPVPGGLGLFVGFPDRPIPVLAFLSRPERDWRLGNVRSGLGSGHSHSLRSNGPLCGERDRDVTT